MSRGTDRFDRGLFLSAFHQDAMIAAGPIVGTPPELYDWASEIQRVGHSSTYHVLLNHSCDIDGDTAHTETYYLYIATNRDDTNLLAGGRYIDRFERRDCIWRLLIRNNFIEWASVVPAMVNPLTNVADIFANGAPWHGKDDLSYRRPLLNQREKFIPPSLLV